MQTITKKREPLVSIIMNCHNGEKYLKNSINTIINQTYFNWELIFFNNLSNDNSLKILKFYNDRRIKLFNSRKFLNLYQARNEAIKQSKGKYVCFLDTDDLWAEDKLKRQVLFLENQPKYSMVYSNFYTYIQKKNKIFLQHNNLLPEGKITKKLLKNYSIGILTVMIKKEIFKTLSFKSNLNIIGDFDFFISVSLISIIGCIQKPLATYRIHENNLSKEKLDIYIYELSNWIKENSLNFKKKGITLYYQNFFLFKLKIKYLLKSLNFKNYIGTLAQK